MNLFTQPIIPTYKWNEIFTDGFSQPGDFVSYGDTDITSGGRFVGSDLENVTIQANTFTTNEINVISNNFQMNGTTVISVGVTNYNSLFGIDSGGVITTGQYNTFLGFDTGYSTTEGSNNTFIGSDAGRSNIGNTGDGTGSNNTFIGVSAGYTCTYGVSNLFVGDNSGYYASGDGLTNCYNNVFVGSIAGQGAFAGSTGYENVFVGTAAGRDYTSGSDNTFIGHFCGNGITSGSNNIFIGNYAGGNQTTNSNLLIIDYKSRSSVTTELTNAIIYGVTASTTAAQILRLNSNVGIKTSTFGTSSDGVFAIANGTVPGAHVDNEIQLFSVDSSDATATLGLMLEQETEAIGTFTASDKIKIKINGVEYWIQLDAV